MIESVQARCNNPRIHKHSWILTSLQNVIGASLSERHIDDKQMREMYYYYYGGIICVVRLSQTVCFNLAQTLQNFPTGIRAELITSYREKHTETRLRAIEYR